MQNEKMGLCRFVGGAIACVTLVSAIPAAVATEQYSLELEPEQVASVPSNSGSSGLASVVLNDDETEASIAVQHDVVSPISGGIYRADFDTNGPLVYAFPLLDSPFATTWLPTPAEVADLKAGLLYVQIESTAYPNGDIRGQIAPKRSPEPGDVIITEIMYNPRSGESGPSPAEWIELFNPTFSDIELDGWYFEDEDEVFGDFCTPQRSGAFPPYVLKSGQVLVVIPDAVSNPPSASDFLTAWGVEELVNVVQLTSTGGTANGAIVGLTLSNSPVNDGNDANDFPLANSSYDPCDTNGPARPDDEILTLVADGTVIDVVNYADQAPWPTDDGSASISLVPVDYPNETDLSSYSAAENDNGARWILHAAGDAGGARQQLQSAGVYGGSDIGSPGFLMGVVTINLPPTIEAQSFLTEPSATVEMTMKGADNSRPFLGLLLYVVRTLPAHGTLIDATRDYVIKPSDVSGPGYLIGRSPFTDLRYINDGTCGMDSFLVQSTDGVMYSQETEMQLIVQCGEAAITEIMYNPNSFEGLPAASEWVEILNTTSVPLNLEGWYLEDDLGRGGDFPPYILGPQEAVAIIPSASDDAEFEAAWGVPPVHVTTNGETSAALVGFNLGNLEGDRVRLVRPGGPNQKVVDAVYYDNGGDWPDTNTSGDGVSIYVTPPSVQATAAANDSPAVWSRSVDGVDAAYLMTVDTNGIYNGNDLGSPGQVAGITVVPCTSPADQNSDGSVDAADFAHFALCFGGPEVSPPQNCGCFDVDANSRLDLVDFAYLQHRYAAP